MSNKSNNTNDTVRSHALEEHQTEEQRRGYESVAMDYIKSKIPHVEHEDPTPAEEASNALLDEAMDHPQHRKPECSTADVVHQRCCEKEDTTLMENRSDNQEETASWFNNKEEKEFPGQAKVSAPPFGENTSSLKDLKQVL